MKKSALYPVLLILAMSFALAGCGRQVAPTAPVVTDPGPVTGPTTDFTFTYVPDVPPPPPATMTYMLRSARPTSVTVDLGSGPVIGDSLFLYGTLAVPMKQDWQSRIFMGLWSDAGSLDRAVPLVVPNQTVQYEFVVNYKHGLEKEVPMMGLWSANGIPITAVNHGPFGQWNTFTYKSGGTIDQIRNDRPLLGWYECQASGILHPDSTAKNTPVSGGQTISFFATWTRLVSFDGIFVDNPTPVTWRFPIFGMKGRLHYIRADWPTGMMVIPGVNMTNTNGAPTQLQNFANLGDASNTFYVFETRLTDDGSWVNPRPTEDDRYGKIIIGASALKPNSAQRQQLFNKNMTTWRKTHPVGLNWPG